MKDLYTTDLTSEFDELTETVATNPTDEGAREDLALLSALLEELRGAGGDEQWQGDWFPDHLIHEDNFVQHVKDMLEDCGIVPADLPWYVSIDWDDTASNVRVDYSSVDYRGETYWFRR